MYTYRIRGKRGPFKIILPASFCSFLTLPGMSGSPPLFSDYLYFYSFMDRNVHAHFYRQPISIDCQVLFIFFFSGRLCRNRYCTFLDFQNRFDKVCRIVFRFVRRSAVRSPASCEIGNGTYSWKFAPAISPVSLHAPKDGIRLPQSVTYLPYPFPHRMAFLLSLGKGSAREIPFFHWKNNKEEQAGFRQSHEPNHAEPWLSIDYDFFCRQIVYFLCRF